MLALQKRTVIVLRVFNPLTREATLAVKVKAVPVSRVQYQYPNARYCHVRPLQTSVMNCSPAITIWAIGSIQTVSMAWLLIAEQEPSVISTA